MTPLSRKDRPRSATVTVSSRLAAAPERVWEHARTMAGVNRELAPFVRMHVPRSVRPLTLDEAPIGEVAFRSLLLAFGVLPFDRHDLRLVEVTPGSGFRERSASLLQRRWEHDRSVVTDGAGSIVTDHVVVTPRLAPARVVRPVLTALFRHRHRRLRSLFGSAASS